MRTIRAFTVLAVTGGSLAAVIPSRRPTAVRPRPGDARLAAGYRGTSGFAVATINPGRQAPIPKGR